MTSANYKVPATKKGWMRKQGRSGVYKNWKKRFFVLSNGAISYYEEEIDVFPFGERLKGDLNLTNTEIMEENKKYNENQIFIITFNGEHNMLMEAETKDDATSWIKAIRDHIKFANESNNTTTTNSVNFDTSDSIATIDDSGVYTSSPSDTTLSKTDPSVAPAPILRPPTAFRRGSSLSVKLLGSTLNNTDGMKDNNNTTTAEVNPNQAAAIAVTKEKVEFKTFCNELPNYLLENMNHIIASDTRNKLISDYMAAGKSFIISAFLSINEGEIGKRGEKWLSTILILTCCILIGLHSIFERFIQFFIKLSARFYIIIGILMIANGLLELKSNMSFFYAPTEHNKLITSGIFRFVRHPIYGGLLLLCFGISISSQKFDKLVLTMVLGVILDKVSDIEEAALLHEHPLAYRAFINSRKKFIPFLI